MKKSLTNSSSRLEQGGKGYELSALFEVAKQFLEIKDLGALKQQVVISSLGMVGARGGTLLELDPSENTLILSATFGPNLEAPPKMKFTFRKKWQSFLIRKNSPLNLINAGRDSKLRLFARANHRLIRTLNPNLLLPIQHDKKLLGILCLQKRLLNRRYSVEDLNLLSSLVSLTAKSWVNLISLVPSQKKETVTSIKDTASRLSSSEIKRELSSLRKKYPVLKQIVGESEAVFSVFRSILEVAKTKCPVLILGQTGTGKELVARCIHQLSSRRDQPFVEINCASVPAELIESELFGYEKGAFTGATGERKGIFQQADNGSLFLDEIGDMSLNLQTKLLRVIQESRFRRLGGEKNIEVDVRLMAASNKDLVSETRRGNFREDLLYRINVYPVYLPTLEERRKDIPLLAEHFLSETASDFGLPCKFFSADALSLLMNFRYPGNIRELKNLVERVAIRSGDEKVIEYFWLEQELGVQQRECSSLSTQPPDEMIFGQLSGYGPKDKPPLVFEAETDSERAQFEVLHSGQSLADVERSYILRILKKTDLNKSQAARILGIPRSTLIGKMKKLKIT